MKVSLQSQIHKYTIILIFIYLWLLAVSFFNYYNIPISVHIVTFKVDLITELVPPMVASSFQGDAYNPSN